MEYSDLVLANFFGIVSISVYTRLSNFISVKQSSLAVASFYLFGTLIHELSHLLMVLATFSRPTRISLIPRWSDVEMEDGSIRREWVLGGVSYIPSSALAYLPAGMAPLLLLLLALHVYENWLIWFGVDWLSVISLYVVVYILVSSSIPSPTDIRVAFTGNGWVVWVFITIMLVIAYRFHVKELLDV